ncbi:MAG: toll/interleukin-1 receptor domain-containing protein [Acidobacteriia bacterium]|nr:toll/interleukin-1 receptor domain-containing protein [Terriglobia bacterium]
MATFVSYARPDAPFALRLAADLRAAAVEVWLDQLDIKPGEPWDQAVEQAIKCCDSLLVVLSPRAVDSRPVMDEVSYALEANKRIVPVVVETCELPFRLRRLHYTDFTTDYDAALRRLLAAFPTRAPEDRGGPPPTYVAPGGAATSRPRTVNWASRRPRLLTGLWTFLTGGLLAGVAQIFIYAHDPRLGMVGSDLHLSTAAAVGGVIAGLIWGIAGIVAGPRREALVGAVGVSFVALVGWISVFGTYQDVMSAAVVFGWPVGGIIGAWIGVEVLKYRARKRGRST